MKKASLFIAVALTVAWTSAAPLTLPASAQDFQLGPIIDPGIAGQAAARRQIAEEQ